jgi:hypothetical protein
MAEIFHDERAFNAFMEALDDELKANEVAISLRPIAALIKTSTKLNAAIPFGSEDANAINAWFEIRYGDRLLRDFTIGRTVVPIKGDPFPVRLPLVYGEGIISKPMEWVEGITPSMLGALSIPERDEIIYILLEQYDRHNEMNVLPPRATEDLVTSAFHLLHQTPKPGLSKWASLQAVEKALKEYIDSRKERARFIHELVDLAEHAEKLGLPACSRGDIAMVQCAPRVRYDQPVKLVDAMLAHQAAIRLCGHIGQHYM